MTNIVSTSANGGKITLDPNEALVAIDTLDCKNSGLIYVGNTAGDEPVFKSGTTGEMRVGLLEAKKDCGGPI